MNSEEGGKEKLGKCFPSFRRSTEKGDKRRKEEKFAERTTEEFRFSSKVAS